MERLASATGIKFDSNIDNIDNVLSKENEIQLFRIIQEMLNNIIKHSKAKKVNFVVKRMVMFIKLYIFDDGVGFNINSSSIGSGLINIDERIRLMKGTYDLKTEPNKGTNFEVTIPVK
jgi:signal transduction histidine kinase